ncbi:MAG: hypothetical protein NVV74_11865 [Magnetospirillum sp.]|nr:hypothetical protein [Magnetospirillum sp.]
MRACHELEIALGLTRTNHGLGRDDASLAPIKGKAADMEAHTGVESFARWVRDTARDDLLAAKDTGWPELHKVAAQHGLEIRPRGAGLVFVDADKPDRAVKAFSIDRSLSMGALVKACGPFQPAQDKEPARQTYRPCPLDQRRVPPLLARYRAERQEVVDKRAQHISAWRTEQRQFRREVGAWYREERHKLVHHYVQAATRGAQEAARDVEPGDRVMFYQGRPIITHSHDLGHGR